QPDITLLYDLGWDRKHQLRLFQGEITLFAVVSFSLSLLGLWLLTDFLQFDYNLYGWQVGTAILIFLVLIALLSIQFRHMYHVDGESFVKVSNRFRPSGLAEKSLFYYRKHIFPPFLQI